MEINRTSKSKVLVIINAAKAEQEGEILYKDYLSLSNCLGERYDDEGECIADGLNIWAADLVRDMIWSSIRADRTADQIIEALKALDIIE